MHEALLQYTECTESIHYYLPRICFIIFLEYALLSINVVCSLQQGVIIIMLLWLCQKDRELHGHNLTFRHFGQCLNNQG